jgi:hypothetical protein
VGKAIYRAWELGAKFDAWDEFLKHDIWQKAFEDSALDMNFYAQRERHLEEVLPWAHINVGVSTEFLKLEYERALTSRVTLDCRLGICNGCGLERQDPVCPRV